MENQQLCILNDAQKQVILTSQLGDGCLYKQPGMTNEYYVTNSKSLEYVTFKKQLLSTLSRTDINRIEKNGYSQTYIYAFRSLSHPYMSEVKSYSLQTILSNLNDLGIALWFYDDASLHNTKNYYHLYTCKFTLEEHENIIIPFFASIGITAKIRIDRKKDGRIFYYISIGKYDGAEKISSILNKYRIEEMSYKIWSSETIQKWSKLQEKLKSENKSNISTYHLGRMMMEL